MKQVLLKFFLITVALLLSGILLAQDLWDGKTIASGFHAGTGSESDPYQIRTGAQLMYFAKQINLGNDFSGKTVKMMNDIDMNRNTSTFLSISNKFAGTFDGNNHILTFQFRGGNGLFPQVSGRICRLGVIASVYRTDKYPFYGGIYIVSNLDIGGVVEDCYYQIDNSYLYGVSASLVRINNGTLRNCYATGRYSVSDTGNSGTLVYMNYGTVENCSSTIIVGSSLNFPMVWLSSGTVVHNTNNIDELNSWVDENPSHSRWCSDGYRLVDFNPSEYCTVEFVDTLFHQTIPSITVKQGECIGTLPILASTWSHTGWVRAGQEVEENDVVDNSWTLFARWEQLIRKQPTVNDMSFEADDEEHASYQWYAIYGGTHNLGSWESTNHGSNTSSSETFKYPAKAGQILKFNYIVSSESGCDVFQVYCNGKYMEASGEKSGEFIYEFPESGDMTLILQYSKDEDTNHGHDKVIVSNICISDPNNILPCTSTSLPVSLIDKNGLYYCKISYSNTGKEISTDTIYCTRIIGVTDISLLTDAIWIEPTTARIGGDVNIEICLKNAQAASAYNFDLMLPEGVTIAKDSNGKYIDALSNRHDDHTRTFNYKGDNTYSFATLSGNSEALTGNDGAIRLVTLHVADNMAEGSYPIEIRNASYSLTDGTLHSLENTTTSITVENYLLGDVNGNNGVDIGDAVTIVNYLVGKPTTTFVEKAADTNKNNQVDIGDAVTIVNYLVGKTASLSRKATDGGKEPQ